MVLSMEKYSGKVAVVTGASAGIGKAIAEQLVRHGVIVAALARRLNRLEDLAKDLSKEEGKIHPYKCDITNRDEIISVFKDITTELGPISILVNNAGLNLYTNLIDGDIDKWKTILDTNVLGLSVCTREAIASMKANKMNGHIVHINSVAGHTVLDIPHANMYWASKHAVTALAETLRLEINREKLPIKVTSVSPGATDTEIMSVWLEDKISELEELSSISKMMSPEDIADAVIYVLSTPDHVNVKELTVVTQGQVA